MRLLALPRYARKGPSSRLRFYQFHPFLTQAGFDIEVYPLLPDDYLDALYQRGRWPFWRKLVVMLRRLRVLTTVGRYDVIWIEKEIFPFLPAWAERVIARRVPLIADYDDAWHLRYHRLPVPVFRQALYHKIETVMRQARLVVVGNPTLAAFAHASGASWIAEVPTVLDLAHYRPAVHTDRRPLRIVWIGSSLNSRYLVAIAGSLATVCSRTGAELVVVGGHGVELPGVPVRFEPWSEETEADVLEHADIGIMPLNDTGWERGKCAFKILQYMAAGLPFVASPVGVNNTIVTDDVGILARGAAEWTAALMRLAGDVELRTRLGSAGRAKIERDFSLSTWGPRVARLMLDAATTKQRRT